MIDEHTDLIRIAKREHNKKRNYLVVNRLQGKHIPVQPDQALGMFAQLAERLEKRFDGEKTLVIGFAETATAIGATVAIKLGAYYIQTTREEVEGAQYLYFSEEHSHATQQRLVRQDLDGIMPKIGDVVFVEDEVTTGNTIRNLVQTLEQVYPRHAKYTVASILNGMDSEAQKIYQSIGIDLCYLVKTEHSDYEKALQKHLSKGRYWNMMLTSNPSKKEDLECGRFDTKKGTNVDGRQTVIMVKEWMVEGCVNARRLIFSDTYQKACEDLWYKIDKRLHEELKGRILVLGTEEFMYPALYAADQIAKSGANVWFHATTRSPIEVYQEEDYPLHERYELPSLYEKDRRTFLYDIGKFDLVLVITDASCLQRIGVEALVRAAAINNDKIYVVRWC